MTLAPGSRLGPYEIVAPIGAGGMGEVYRARDPRVGRFLMMKEVGQGTPAAEASRRINIALDWFEELKQRVPTGKE